MSAIATVLVGKYDITLEMNELELTKYTSEFLKNLTDHRKRNQAKDTCCN